MASRAVQAIVERQRHSFTMGEARIDRNMGQSKLFRQIKATGHGDSRYTQLIGRQKKESEENYYEYGTQ